MLRARKDQVLSVVLPAPALLDALRSIDNTVLVMQVTPGGASDRAGMLPGDVITRINGQGFSGALDADRIMRASQVGRSARTTCFATASRSRSKSDCRRSASASAHCCCSSSAASTSSAARCWPTLRARTSRPPTTSGSAGWAPASRSRSCSTRPRRTLPTWYVFTSDVLPGDLRDGRRGVLAALDEVLPAGAARGWRRDGG